MVELLIATFLTISLFGIILATLHATRNNVNDQQTRVASQTGARTVLDLVRNDIDEASYGATAALASGGQLAMPAQGPGGILVLPNNAGRILYYLNNHVVHRLFLPTSGAQHDRAVATNITSLAFSIDTTDHLVTVRIEPEKSPYTYSLTRMVRNP